MALFSMHLEASYLPGGDAKTVFDVSSEAIRLAGETARKLDGAGEQSV
jgi:hypothetical protein